jgi:hypothetical protein
LRPGAQLPVGCLDMGPVLVISEGTGDLNRTSEPLAERIDCCRSCWREPAVNPKFERRR